MDENKLNQNNNSYGQNFKNANSKKIENTYKKFKNTKQGYNSNSSSFGKTVILPFFCGILGSIIIIGICLSSSSIKEMIVQKLIIDNNVNSNFENTTLPANLNNQLISLKGYSDTAVGVAKKVQPSIVAITVEYSINSIFNRTAGTISAKGSGIIISEDGYILTNNHVINSESSKFSSNYFYEIGKANKISVKLYNDDKEYDGEIIGTDTQTDLAVIKIKKDGLIAAELGNSDNIQVGEFVMAIGSPLGFDNSVTAGIVSGINREISDDNGNKYKAIQTDSAINSGNSGGALVNSNGQVIGVNTLKLSGNDIEGVGFAIPINATKDIYNQLIQYNKVKRPYMGIGGIDLTEELAKANNLVVGVYIKTIDDFSAAEKAGLKSGDVIIEVDGIKIKTMDEINEIKNKKSIGDEIKVKVNRDGKEKILSLKLQEQP